MSPVMLYKEVLRPKLAPKYEAVLVVVAALVMAVMFFVVVVFLSILITEIRNRLEDGPVTCYVDQITTYVATHREIDWGEVAAGKFCCSGGGC